MTMIASSTESEPALPSGGWRLESFHSDGATASCSADLRIAMSIGPDGSVVLESDDARATGSLVHRDGAAAFVDMVLDQAPWGQIAESLEDRVARCLTGTYQWSAGDGRLTLFREGCKLHFVSA